RKTTSNRVELIAAIKALESLPAGAKVLIRSDSQQLVLAMTVWVHDWQRNGWKNSRRKPVENKDLYLKLLELCSTRDVVFDWVPGHSGIELNERADALANEASNRADLEADEAYERSKKAA